MKKCMLLLMVFVCCGIITAQDTDTAEPISNMADRNAYVKIEIASSTKENVKGR